MKTHTKANGYFKDVCHFSKTGWAWWRYPQLGDVTTNPYCTCKPCTPPNNRVHSDAGDSAASQALSPQSGESTPEVDPAATQRR